MDLADPLFWWVQVTKEGGLSKTGFLLTHYHPCCHLILPLPPTRIVGEQERGLSKKLDSCLASVMPAATPSAVDYLKLRKLQTQQLFCHN